ncbi:MULTISPECIES: cell division protein ZapE [unclassified Pseudomonas]|uniref:cell division protein ZapE n=1 Tax=unclassified Pseudomonas TaxID=196821 RepID=UPI001CBEC44A|nr:MULTISPECIES: cell division protein ZapE [unclassified Pseudomonas]
MARGYCADPSQRAAIKLLDKWLGNWLRERRVWLPAPKDGVYLWGGVGRGKSFVMDAFFAAAPLEAKRRVHFHAFLQGVLERLKQITGQRDPLVLIASEIAADTKLLCFDEFHVHDIGDAMLLGRLLAQLIDQGVGMVATSNYAPQALCPNPLYRDRFKPTIEMIDRRFNIYHLDGGKDYRLNAEGGNVWGGVAQVAADTQADWVERRLKFDWSAERNVLVEVNHRPMKLRARQQATAWLDFEDLCRVPHSSADFLWLSRTFKRLAITAVPTLDDEGIDVQQRFLNLIDILYDSGIELFLITEEGPQALLTATALLDYSRTCSRLQQLQILEPESMDRVNL